MRLPVIVLLMLAFTVSAQAQKKKKSKKEAAETTVEAPAEIVLEEEAPVIEEIRMVEVAPPADATAQNLRDENGPYYMYDTYSSKDVAVVYRGSGYDNRQYALLKVSTQKLITPFIFESISGHFSQSDFATVSINGRYGTVNNKGEVAIPLLYDRFSYFFIDEQIYFIASANGMYGIINETNDVIIPFEYENLSSMYNFKPYLQAKKNGKFGLLDPVSKKVILPFVYDELETYSNNNLRVKKDNLYNYIDITGKPALSKWYSSLSLHDENMLIARLNGRDGLIDLSEKIYIPFEYDRIERSYMEGAPTYIVQKNGKYGLASKEGVIIIAAQYDNLRSFSSNATLLVTKDNRKGIISKEGQVILPIEYDEIERSDRNVLVRKNGKFNILNRDMQPLFPVQYEDIQQMVFEGNYNPSYYMATKAGKKGILDLSGKVVVDFAYDNFIPSSNNYRPTYRQPLMAVKGGKQGMVDLNNKVIVPFEYDHLLALNSFLLIVGKKGKFGVTEIYNTAALTLPIEYSFITYKQGSNLIAFKGKFLRYKVSGNKVTLIE